MKLKINIQTKALTEQTLGFQPVVQEYPSLCIVLP